MRTPTDAVRIVCVCARCRFIHRFSLIPRTIFTIPIEWKGIKLAFTKDPRISHAHFELNMNLGRVCDVRYRTFAIAISANDVNEHNVN